MKNILKLYSPANNLIVFLIHVCIFMQRCLKVLKVIWYLFLKVYM